MKPQKKASKKTDKLKTYTVIAIYKDNHQRYATVAYASSPEEAEKSVQIACAADNKWDFDPENPPLLIAGVVRGDVKMADTHDPNAG